MAGFSGSGAYVDPGPYKTGVWLVKLPNGKAGIYQKSQLPKPDGKIQYFWIGASKTQIQSRYQDAIDALGVDISQLTGGVSGSKFGPSGTNAGLTGIPQTISDSINSATDFLKLVGWIFHPRNILRAAEFLTGIVLMVFGLWAAIQSRGEKLEGFTSGESPLSRSGLGRVSRALASQDGTRAAPHATRRRAQQRGLENAAYGRRRP